MPVLMFGSWVLKEIWIIDLSPDLVAFFTICAKLPVTMAFTCIFLDVIVVLDLKKNTGGSTDLAKKGTDRRICIPLLTPLI